MALLEMIGLGSDKQAVILEIGEAYSKIGFAGEAVPRHIIPSKIKRLVGNKLIEIKVVNHKANEKELYEILREFLHSIYFKFLLVNPKERRVVLSESIFVPDKFRNVLAKVLLTYFDVSSLMLAPGHLFSLFTLGVPSALVVDCGYDESLIVPIYEHTPILSAIESFQVAGKVIHKNLKEELLASTGQNLDEDTIENIKVTSCFVGRYGEPPENVPPPAKYTIGNDLKIMVDGKLRAHTFDLMFDGDEEGKSLASYILDSILRCPIDCRKTLSENILLIGGTTMTPGFKARLLAEIKGQLKNNPYSKKFAIDSVKLCQTPVQANYISWLGAAIYGTLEILPEYSISREKYKQKPFLPDWASLASQNTQTDRKVREAREKLTPSYRKSVSQTGKS